MALDAIIIADSGSSSFSGTNPLKLTLDDRVADIQTLKNYIVHDGRIIPPIDGNNPTSWAAAPKLNGIYLKSYLAAHDFKTELIGSYFEERDAFIALLARSPRAIMISTTYIISKPLLTQLAADIRCLAPDIPIIAGGPFVYLSHCILQRSHENGYLSQAVKKEYLFLETEAEPAVDLFIISPRGEDTACRALRDLKTAGRWGEIPNTACFKDGGYHFSDRVDDFTLRLSPIDWQGLDADIFRSGVVPMQASSGCPYHCAFCNFVKNPRLDYIKPVAELIEEMRRVSRRGARYIWFVDDNFRLGKHDLEDICRMMIAADLHLSWMTFVRAGTLEHIDPLLLRRAGCIEVQLGLESADPQVLENMNKKASPRLYEKVIKKVLGAGINCSCYLIFGFPGETEASVERTIAFMKTFDDVLDGGTISWSMFPFFLAPLSPIYEPAMRERYHLEGGLHRWRHATMDSAQALQHVLNAFLSIENSGSIYRSDDLDLLGRMTPRQRNLFQKARQALAQKAVKAKPTREDILRAFKPIRQDLPAD